MKHLKDILPEGRVLTEEEDLYCYSYDASSKEAIPSAVVRPVTTEEVSRVVRFASENTTPVVPRGAGTGMTGGAVPLRGSIVVSLEAMNRIIEIDEKNMVVTVEPGVINAHLKEKIESFNLFYPPDPSSMDFCTLGGNVAENAGGPRAIKYGVTRDYVLGLEMVIPDGRVITVGVRTMKGVVGYDLTRLIVGSEGTLGIITKIFLRVIPMPEETITLLCVFNDLDMAADSINRVMASGIIPSTLEFMDHDTIVAVENFRRFGLPSGAEALLLIELDGMHKVVAESAERVASICSASGGDVKVADDPFSRKRLWEARKAVSPALYHISPLKINEDIVVPRSNIPELIRALKEIERDRGIKIVCFGHAGDGNIHVNIMADRERQEVATATVREIFEVTLRLGGTISGEHGVGITKSPYIDMELNRAEIELMKGIKRVFDPVNIMNPGKIFPGHWLRHSIHPY
jgi:glycolate oxidase